MRKTAPWLWLLAAPLPAPAQDAVSLPVEETFSRLLSAYDKDGDKKITIEDAPSAAFRVPGGALAGAYPLSVLLQELSLARERGEPELRLPRERLSENPVDRTSRLIRELFWDSLTRTIDEKGLESALADEKSASADGPRRLYVPHGDEPAFAYFSEIAARRQDLRLAVERLPAAVDGRYVRGLDGRHGLLSLALVQDADGTTRGAPFVVPGGRFNELYGWDSHFIVLGLLEDGKLELAKSMIANQVYEIRRYGRILNANRSYYLTRSQPPFLSSTVRAVYERLPKTPESKAWLEDALAAVVAEYEGVWTKEPRLLAKTGLSRYYDEGHGPCPEVEPGHYDYALKPYADKAGTTPARYLEDYLAGRVKEPALDSWFLHDRAVRESGHDTTYRFDGRTADFLTVDLNSLLYKIELDLAELLEQELGKDGGPWRRRAEARKKAMNALFWDAKRGLFFDYDHARGRRSSYVSATTFYPLWAGWASPEQARAVLKSALPELERLGGLASTGERSRGPLSEARPARQWDYPYGWAPHQMLAWEGLLRYGHGAEARRLAYRWLWAIVKNARDYNGTVPEKLDVEKASHQVFAEYGNVGTHFSYITKEGFGWMNSSFQVGLKLLDEPLARALREQKHPNELFPGK